MNTRDVGMKQATNFEAGGNQIGNADTNLAYNLVDVEPAFHGTTYIALSAILLLNFTKAFAIQGPPAVVGEVNSYVEAPNGRPVFTQLSYIGKDLDSKASQPWIPNSASLVQAVITPLLSSTSATFQVRKSLLGGACLISFVGAAIVPGSASIHCLIVAQIMIGFDTSTVALGYCIPSEILPRRWRPSE